MEKLVFCIKPQIIANQCSITANNIYGPLGQTDMSVGIFMRDSDYSIGGNYAGLGTNFAGNFISDVTVGIAVIGGTEDPTAVISPEIKNNTISRTNVAIHTINNNEDLDIACNQLLNYNYRGINIRSWNGTQGNLKDQGDCDIPSDQHPAFNTFFPLGALPKDLFADATSLDFKYADIGALSLTVNDPVLITREGCLPTTATCNTYQPAALSQLIDNSTPAKTKYKILSEWLRQYQADSNYTAAKQLLQQVATPMAIRKRIQDEYENEAYTTAKGLLDGMSIEKLEDQQFNDLQRMLINLKETGSSYQNLNDTQVETLLQMANSPTEAAYRAQAVLYMARGYEFPVILPNEEGNYTYSVFKTATNNALTNATTFSTLYPNPTKDQLFLDYALDNEQQATISLFDLNGRIVKQDKLTGNGKLQWLVDTLPSGFYYYQIQQNNETTITNKVIIIK